MGRTLCFDKSTGLKKGPWAAEEDQKLIDYIQNHGLGSWRSVPKKAGLARCGKSCRLRWTNYLRPDIKRGKFSLEEEERIVQLHRIVGNKWSTIASHLPGRTDNEIKNYWNTHVRKRLARIIGSEPLNNQISHLDFSSLSRQLSLGNPSALIITLCRLLGLQPPLLKREHMMNVLAMNLISSSQNSEPSSSVGSQHYLNSQQITDQPFVSQRDLDGQVVLQNDQIHNYTAHEVVRPDDEILFQGEDTNLWNGMLSQIDKLMKEQRITSNSNLQAYSLPQLSTESFSCLGGFTDNQIACHNLAYAATATDSNTMNSPTSTYCVDNSSSEKESTRSNFLEFQIPDVSHLADRYM